MSTVATSPAATSIRTKACETVAGTSWVDIGTGLPDIPVNDIIMDRCANLYLATDIGVLASLDDGTTWEVLGDNMPAVVVTDMHIHEIDELLYAATYGRSAYKLDLSSNPLSTETSVIVEDISVYPNPATDHVNIVLSNSAENVSVALYDTMGRIVVDKVNSEENRIELNISGIASGIYYLKISIAENSVVKKLMIK